MCVLASSAIATPGSIWTTNGVCGDTTQDVNEYGIGETVFVNGNNFPAGSAPWDITGQPGQASCDPGATVASGNVVIDSSGTFCFEAYTVAADDCGVYKVDVNGKNHNYHIEEQEIPEFGLIAGGFALIGALGAFFILRR